MATFDGAYVRLYVDGQLDTTQGGQQNCGYGHSTLRIGGNQEGPNYLSFVGSIDRVSIYPNTVLSLERIQAHHEAVE